MKNVLIFALGGERRAIELRWVREVSTLAALTPVPTAPATIAGVTNCGGAIVPVLFGEAGARPPRVPQSGDALVLIDVDGARAALAVDRVDAVTTLAEGEHGLIDGHGQTLALLDAPALMAAARAAVAKEAGHGPRP